MPVLTLSNFSKLRALCNMMIAVRAFCDVLHQGGHFLAAYFYFSNARISHHFCFYIELLPIFGLLFGTILNFAISIDRMCAVVSPINYSKLKIYLSLFVIITLTLGYIIPLTISVYTGLNAFELAPCGAITFVPKIFAGPFFIVFSLLNFGTVLVYCIIWILIRNKVILIKKHLQVLKPITIIVFFLIIGYGLNIILNVVVEVSGISVKNSGSVYVIIYRMLGITINIALASEYFIYFAFKWVLIFWSF